MSVPLIAARELTAGYRRVAAVRELNLDVHPGEVIAILGANGAGKTTTLLTLAGAIPALGGTVEIDGQPTKAPLHRRSKAGVMLVPEERSVFMSLTTADNLRLGPGPPERALEIFPELGEHLHRRAGLLSGGQQQMLTVARALAGNPKVLLADELSLGLAPLLVRRLLDAVRAVVRERQLGAIIVEQQIRSALRVADRVYVLQRGRVALEGTAAELRNRVHEIERVYLQVPEEATT